MDFGAFAGFVGKVLGTALLTAGAVQVTALAWVWSYGPNGAMQPRPACEAGRTCIVVAGLKDDVSLGFGASGEVIGLDAADDAAQRVASDLSVVDSEQRAIQVLRYPEEISPPKAGASNYAQRTTRALERAQVVGSTTQANLVIIGRVVSDDLVRLSFVDPRRPADTPPPFDYQLGNSEERQRLLAYMSTALNAVHDGRPVPPAPRDALPVAPRALPEVPVEKPEVTVSFTPEPPPPPPTTIAPQISIERARIRALPEGSVMNRVYPARARERGERGRVSLACRVALDGSLHSCTVINETPTDSGFGRAALRLVEHTTGFPELQDGEPVADGEVRFAYTFVLN